MREFVIGVLLIPSGVTFVWFAILGGTALHLQLSGAANLTDAVAQPEVALFTLLGEFPIAAVTSVVVIVLVGVFFVSGADAASIVMGMLSCRGALDPPRLVVALWGTLMGAVAIVLLGLAVSLHRALRAERPPVPELQPSVAVPEPGPAVTEPGRAGGS